MPTPSPSSIPRTRITQIVLFVAFGLWLPWTKGAGFLDTVLLGAYTCLGVVFAAPVAAETKTVLRPVLTGLVWSWAMLFAGILTVYMTRTVVVGPDLRTVAECGLFGAALSLAVTAFIAWLANAASENAARICARLVLLTLLAGFFLYSRWLPDVALRGAVISTLLAALFLELRRRQA
jgi:hypothetical protein